MRKNHTNGKLITFCGLDGCGKSTMIKKLIDEIGTDYQIFLTKQPTDFVRKSDIFRTYMDSPNHNEYDYRSLSLLAASDRVQHSNKIIEPQMASGNIVISDRYFYSCLANLRARGYKNDHWIYEIAESIIQPDIAFFLDVPVNIAIERVRERIEEKHRYINIDLQYDLRQEYLDICKSNGGILVPTSISQDESYNIIINEVRKVLNHDTK